MAAREAYEALTDAQKQYVTEETMAVMEKCENRILELESAENPDGPDVTPTPTPDEEVTLTYQNYPISVTGKGLSGWDLRLEALTASDSDVKLMQKEITSKEALETQETDPAAVQVLPQLEARREQEVSRPVMKRICCRMFRR